MTFGPSIPGETPIDPSGLKDRDIGTRAELNAAEAANVRRAVIKYLNPARRLARFDYWWALRLHKEMFGRVWDWAGQTRKLDLNIGVPWHNVEPQLYSLFQDVEYWESVGVGDLLNRATELHFKAVQIHPFLNGNGRWSRLLANIWLMRHNSPVVAWPEETIGQTSVIRDEYLDAVRRADQWDFTPLRELHRRYMSSE
jgi:Fic-DOC domain mobile mystery protein B